MLYKKSIEREASPKTTREASGKQEKAVSKAIGGKQTKNSGATLWQKGDIILDNWLIECKSKMTESDSISIKKEWLDKLKQEACFMGKEYEALIFNFGPNEKNYAIIDMSLFQTLLNYVERDV